MKMTAKSKPIGVGGGDGERFCHPFWGWNAMFSQNKTQTCMWGNVHSRGNGKKSNIMLFYGLCSKSFVMLFWFLLLFQSVVILRADVRKRGRVPGVQKALAD